MKPIGIMTFHIKTGGPFIPYTNSFTATTVPWTFRSDHLFLGIFYLFLGTFISESKFNVTYAQQNKT